MGNFETKSFREDNSKNITVLLQYMDITYKTIPYDPCIKLSHPLMMHSHPVPQDENDLCTQYFAPTTFSEGLSLDKMPIPKNETELMVQTIRIPFLSINGHVITENKHGTLIKLIKPNASYMFNYKCGPTIPCQYIFLLRTGYTIPIAQISDIVNIQSFGPNGCTLKWKN